MKKAVLIALCALLAVASLGCGKKKPDGMPDLEPTFITIVQDGAPLAEAMINMKAEDASNKWTCGGRTDEKGVAAIVTHGQYKGVPVGKYKVSVNKTIGEGTPPPPSPIDAESARVYQEYIDSGATYEEFYVVDKKFSIVDTTPLEIEVVKGKNEFTLDVGAATHDPVKQSHGVAKPSL